MKARKQIVVRMADATFLELKSRAAKEGCSMQQKMLDYIKVGLEVDRDWDIDEPERHCKAAAAPSASRSKPDPRPDLPELQGVGQDFWDR